MCDVLRTIRTKVVWGVLMTIALCAVDAAFTLMHIRFAKGTEWNPAMAYLLDNYGVYAFVWTKMCLTSAGMMVLAWFYRQRLWAQVTFWGMLVGYVVLTWYHLFCAIRYWKM